MAASDQNYRNQYTLDIVFAVSSILMLVSIVWMFMQDFYREYRTEQRSFRDVEAAVAQRVALEQIPNKEAFDQAEEKVKKAQEERNKNLDKIREIKDQMAAIQPKKERSEKTFQDIKAFLESKLSFYNIEVEEHGIESAEKKYRQDINDLNRDLGEAKAVRDKHVEDLSRLQRQLEELESPLTVAQSEWKKVNDKFETQVKLAINKQWGFGDVLRSFPVVEMYASPIKIQQFTINDIPIDYNFKQVTRFDRCMTCHQGIDRPAYSKEMLKSLTEVKDKQKEELKIAQERLKKRKQILGDSTEARNVPDPNKLRLTTLSKNDLTDARINEYCAHPRLDLFVGGNSKHPAESFGCTSCHGGQGSGTGFNTASHTPNNSGLQDRWTKEHHWASNHMWDFPMLPMRFIESSCLKCHPQVTDLYSVTNRNEAPKLLRGYNLFKENGCFGCHEVQGRKGGRVVGPDLRLESNPPLEELSAEARARIEADVDNKPGDLRKVGPSLYRLSEKTSKEWTVRWLRSPRDFRPDTKMPHFYGLANNHPDILPEAQKEFPDAEMHAIAHFLFEESNRYLKKLTDSHQDSAAEKTKDQELLQELQTKSKLSDEEVKKLGEVQTRIKLRKTPPLVDLAPGYQGNKEKGRQLFSERGCLACHQHKGTETALGDPKDLTTYGPAVTSEAQFGPNLSQVAGKLGQKLGDKESARKWLVQWIMDPHVHSPRSRMPVTHLDSQQAADIAAWLLSQPAQDLGNWQATVVPEPTKQTLKNLAQVYLVRLLPRDVMKKLLEGEEVPSDLIKELPGEEQELADQKASEDSLKRYLGKKAVNRLGCYACHDIPGFDNAKPIGVGLNDWGKKPADRLAFEDIGNYLKKHHYETPSLVKDGKPVGAKEGKQPYEKYFYEALNHHSREGFLYQKIHEPRSYDFNRPLAWDDRSRMPQFRFARPSKKAEESDEDFQARSYKDEADTREAVMTFVLGLVAEPVPAKSVNQPTGDRLAEVKGRQILDKYNCGGCHLIRPGVFEFRPSPETDELLERMYKIGADPTKHRFPAHFNWTGKNLELPDRVQAQGVQLQTVKDEDLGDLTRFKLVHALRFPSEVAKDYRSIPASYTVPVIAKDMVYPSPAVVASEEGLQSFLRDQGPFGGAFSDLLVSYLVQKDKERVPPIYVFANGDSSNARAAGPPILTTQGERTQPDWLYQFLLDPQPIRRMAVLRMPKFNMSQDEAQTLVAYFAAVERQQNTGINLPFPQAAIPQQQDLDSSYWRSKNATYVARLKLSKDDKGSTLFDQRLDELKPAWEQIQKDYQEKLGRLQKEGEPVFSRAAKAREAVKSAQDELAKEKDDKSKTALQAKIKTLEAALKEEEDRESFWKAEITVLEDTLKKSSPKEQQKSWEEKEAYLTDAYRLVANRQLCLQCHQVGKLLPAQKLTEGPPLHQVYNRLRPGWTERWIANPQAFLTYPSVMPDNFPAGKIQYQQWFVGSALDQVIATRDVLMVLPRAEAMPINRYLALPLPGDSKGDKK